MIGFVSRGVLDEVSPQENEGEVRISFVSCALVEEALDDDPVDKKINLLVFRQDYIVSHFSTVVLLLSSEMSVKPG